MNANLSPELRAQGEAVFQTLCRALGEDNFHYRTDRNDDGSLVAFGGVRLKSFPTTLIAVVRPQIWLVSFLAKIPCTVPESRRFEVAAAVAAANYNRHEGRFDYNLGTGEISWCMTENYYDSTPGKGLYQLMLANTVAMLNDVGGPLAEVAEGKITLAEFVAKIR